VDTPTIPFQVGELIAGKYRVDRILGAGGMGVVVAATHIDLERPVAVKLIREELVTDAGAVERLMLEAKAAARIKSEHVGKVLDVGKLPNGVPYIVMEFLEGMDVCQLLEQQGPLSIMEAVDFVLQASEALAEAHLANIVHRDLKPENLFVSRLTDGSPHIKVLDFGISKQLGDPGRRQLTNPTSAVGSPQYMAPEQMHGGNIDVRADIWALGAILYELISNRPAFEGSTIPEICIKVMGSQPIPLQQHVPHVPDALAAIVTRCLTKDREQRFASVAELVEHLAPFGSQRSVLSRNRILGLLAGKSVLPSTVRGRFEVTGGATQVATTPGSGVSVSVPNTHAFTPATTDGLASRKAARWPIFAGLGAVLLAGIGLWFFSKSEISTDAGASMPSAEPSLAGEPSAGTDPSAVLDPSAVTAVIVAPSARNQNAQLDAGTPKPRPVVSPALPSAGALPGAGQAPTNPAVAPRRQTRPTPAATTAPRDPKDAWDRDSFGGRH
jgi:serine/threonine-protein kinase